MERSLREGEWWCADRPEYDVKRLPWTFAVCTPALASSTSTMTSLTPGPQDRTRQEVTHRCCGARYQLQRRIRPCVLTRRRRDCRVPGFFTTSMATISMATITSTPVCNGRVIGFQYEIKSKGRRRGFLRHDRAHLHDARVCAGQASAFQANIVEEYVLLSALHSSSWD